MRDSPEWLFLRGSLESPSLLSPSLSLAQMSDLGDPPSSWNQEAVSLELSKILANFFRGRERGREVTRGGDTGQDRMDNRRRPLFSCVAANQYRTTVTTNEERTLPSNKEESVPIKRTYLPTYLPTNLPTYLADGEMRELLSALLIWPHLSRRLHSRECARCTRREEILSRIRLRPSGGKRFAKLSSLSVFSPCILLRNFCSNEIIWYLLLSKIFSPILFT